MTYELNTRMCINVFCNNRLATIYYYKGISFMPMEKLKFRQYIKVKRHKFGFKLLKFTEHCRFIEKLLVYAEADTILLSNNCTQKIKY